MLWNSHIKSIQGLGIPTQSSEHLSEFASHLAKTPYSLYTECRLQKNKQERHALLFSTGFDSTACLYLNPKIEYCFYVCRKGISQGMLRQEKALDSLHKFASIFPNKKFFIIETDVEKLRKPCGYIGDFGMAIPLIPYLDHFGITHLNFGMIGDIAHLKSSSKFRPFVDTVTYKATVQSFENMGIKIVLPTATHFDHTSKLICNDEGVGHLASSCLRGTVESPCGKCRKCFKEGINHARGRSFFGNEQCKIFTDPPQMFYLFSAWRNGTVHKLFPNVQPNLDLSWFENLFYPKGWVCEDDHIKEMVHENLKKYIPMPTEAQIELLESLDTTQYLKPHA